MSTVKLGVFMVQVDGAAWLLQNCGCPDAIPAGVPPLGMRRDRYKRMLSKRVVQLLSCLEELTLQVSMLTLQLSMLRSHRHAPGTGTQQEKDPVLSDLPASTVPLKELFSLDPH